MRLLLPVREQELEDGRVSNIAEIGFRRMINPLTVIAVGAGFGLDDDSPDFASGLGCRKCSDH